MFQLPSGYVDVCSHNSKLVNSPKKDGKVETWRYEDNIIYFTSWKHCSIFLGGLLYPSKSRGNHHGSMHCFVPVTNSHILGVKSLHFQAPGYHIGGYISILFPLWSVINPHLREKKVPYEPVFTIIFPSRSHECLKFPSIFSIIYPSFCHQYHMFLLPYGK